MSTAANKARDRVCPEPSPTKRGLFGGSSSVVISLMLLASGPALGDGNPVMPSGGGFVAGAGSIAGVGGNLTISQQSTRGIIDWKSFSIGQGGAVQFNNGSGATLNRVTGGDLSSILGTLKATGSLYLINPNGVVVGSSGVVVTNGHFVASTLDVANNAFMAGNTLVFKGSSNASVTNLGAISSTGGDVILIAHDVTNAGTIDAPRGTAALAAGQEVLVQDSADEHVFVDAGGGDVTNRGTIDAAQAELKAAGGNVYALAGRSGVIRATGTAVRNGQVWLTATGGDVEVSGAISAQNADGSGGRINAGDWSTAKTEIAAGAVLDASATAAKGDGGSIKVLAKATGFAGTAKARGGSAGGNGGAVETSGDSLSVAGGAVDAGAANGKNGSWLLDPTDVTIDATNAGVIGTALSANTDVTVMTTAGGASGPGLQSAGLGDITVSNAITSTGRGALTLSAYNSVKVNAAVDTHAGNLTLRADNAAVGTGTVKVLDGVQIASSAAISIFYNPSDNIAGGFNANAHTAVNGQSFSVTPVFTNSGGGTVTAYKLVNTIFDLQNMQNDLAGNFWLNTNIDATGFSGFTPIGGSATPFTGVLNSSNQFTISNLTIAASLDYVGLFGKIGMAGAVGNFSLVNASISGSSASGVNLGAVAGENDGAISNMSVLGSVTASTAYTNVGGVAGTNKGALDQLTTAMNAPGVSMALVGGSSLNVGGLAGFNTVLARISNSDVDGTITGGTTNTGGLAGLNNGLLTMANPHSSLVTTSSAANLGGAIGMNDNGGFINFMGADGTIVNTGTNNNVGGMIGLNTSTGSVTGAVSTVTVRGGQGHFVGGFVGLNQGMLTEAGASGTVTSTTNPIGPTFAGGFAGGMTTGSISVAYAQGPVGTTATTNAFVGGFIGFDDTAANPSISQAYATGYVHGAAGSFLAGFVASGNGTIQSSYFDTETTGIATATSSGTYAGVTAQTTTQLQNAGTMTGLPADFTDGFWGVIKGQSFPYFAPAFQGTPQVVSGYAFNSFANQTALAGVTLGAAIGGSTDSNSTTTGANGYYVLLVGQNNGSPTIPASNGNVLLTITGDGTGVANPAFAGNSLVYGATGSIPATPGVSGSGMTIFGGNWLRVAPATPAVAATNLSTILADLTSAVGFNNPGGLLYSLNFSGMSPTFNAFNNGIRLDLEFPNTTANPLVIDTPLLVFGGAVVLNSTFDPGAGSVFGQVQQTRQIGTGALLLKGNGASFGITNTSNNFPNLAVSNASANAGAKGVGIYDTVNLTIGTVAGVSGANSGTLVLDDPGHTVSQAGGTFLNVGSLSLLGADANYLLTGTNNLVGSLAANTYNNGVAAGTVVLADAKNLLITTVSTGNNIAPQGINSVSGVTSGIVGLELNGAFSVTQDPMLGSAITTPNLLLSQLSGTSGGTFSLLNSANAVTNLAANTDINGIAGGTISLADSVALNIATITAGSTTIAGVTTQTLNLIDPIGVVQSAGALVTVSNLLLEGAGGSVNLDKLNLIGTVAANTGAVGITDAPSQTLTIGSLVDPLTSTTITGITTTLGVGLQADQMAFAFGINAPDQPVLLETTTVGRTVNIGAGTGGLLIPTNLQIAAGTLVIGGDGGTNVLSTISEGPIFVNAPVNFTNVTNLALVSNGTVTQSAGSTITTSGLVVEGSNITLNENNSAQRIAMLATGLTGNISFRDIAGTVSITAIGAPGKLTAAGLSAGGMITLNSTGNLAVGPEGVSSGGQLILAAAGNLTLAGGAVVTGLGAGADAVVLAAGNNFVNNSTNAAVLAPNGRWLIFSTNPANSISGSLAGTPLYNQSFNFATDSYAPVANSGNRFIYSFAPKLTVTPNAVSKTYNGTTQTSDGFYTVTGLVNGDDPNFAYSGMAAILGSGRNAGSYMLTASLGTLASDYGYGFNFGTGTLSIGQSALTVQPSSAFKIYDGTTTSSVTPLVTGTIFAGDTRQFTQAYASKNAGNSLLMTVSGLVNDGNGGNNYSYSFVTGALARVGTIGTLQVSLSGGSRAYDGTTVIAPSLLSVANKAIMTDDVSFTSGTGILASKNAGVEQIASLGSLALGGADAANYSLPFFPAGSVTITQAALTVTAAANTKIYDGTTSAAATPTVTSGTAFAGDSGSFSESYATQHTGNGLTLTPAGSVADGNGGANYAVTFTPVTTGVINALPVVLAGTRTYDATTTANFSILSVANAVAGDTVNVASGSGTLAAKDVGSQPIAAFGTLALGNNTFGDYTLNGASGSVNITALGVVAVTISGMKIYDGTTDAPATDLMITDVVSGDMVSLTGTGVLSSKNVGVRSLTSTGGTLTGLGLTGADAANYTLSGGSGSVTITPAALTVTAAANSKTYDGTATAAATPTVTLGTIFAGDTGSFTESYASGNAGTGLTLTPSGSVSDGNGGNNYAVTFAPVMTGVINQRAILVTGMRAYDGTTDVDSSILAITNDVDGANLTLSGSGTLSGQHAGAQTITGAGTLALNGSAKNNYTITGLSSAVTITARAVTLTGTRVYDTTASAASTILSVANAVGGDNVSVASGSATLAGKNVGAEAITSLGTLALGNNGFGDYTLTGASGSVTITAATLTVGLTGTVSKTYDTTTAAALAAGNYTLTGVLGGEAVTLNNPTAGTYDTRNAGTGKTVSVSGLSISGAGAGNYMLASTSTSAAIGTITAATLIYAATAASQSYGSANTTFAGNVTGFVGGETLGTATTGMAAFTSATSATTNIGSYAIAGSGLTANNGNYVFVQAAGNATALTITPFQLTAGLTGTVAKTYDGTAAATLAAGNYTLSAAVNGDVITLNNPASGTYDTKNAGTGKTVSVAGLSISGAKAGNYVLASTSTSGAVGTINAATLTAGLTGTTSKTYDTTTAATLVAGNYALTGVIGVDVVTLNNPSVGTYDSKNAGTGKTVTVAGLSIGGADAGNYVLASNSASAAIGTISAATLTYAGNAASQSYGSANTSFTGTVTGFVGGETVGTATTGMAAFASVTSAASNVGSYAITGSGLTANSGNYVFTQAAGNATALTITPLQLTASLTGTVAKSYDGTTAATLAAGNYALSSTVNGDTITLNNPSSGTFDNMDAGTGKTVSVTGLTIGGVGAGNYVLASTSASGAIGTITPLAVTLSGMRAYDATTGMGSTVLAITNKKGGDSVTLASGSAVLAGKNVGIEGIVDPGTLTLGNNAQGDYTLTGSSGSVYVAVATLNAGLTGSVAKTYDANNTATLSAGNYLLSGVFGGDTVMLNNPTAGTFDTKNTGSGKTVNVTGLSVFGADAGNYALGSFNASGAVGTINAAPLTAGLIGTVIKTYDATAVATLAANNYSLSGIIGGDAVTLSNPTSGTYDTKNAGTGKTVSVTGLTLGGAGAGNYSLASTSASGEIGAINAATLTYTANAASQSYGSANTAFGGTVTGFVGGETLGTATTGTAAFTSATGATSNIGSYAVTGSGLTANSGNYVFTQGAGNATALTITPVQLTASLTGTVARTYDGTAAATLAANNYMLSSTVNGDVITLNNPASGTFDSKNVGTGKTVSVTGLALGGAKAGNYVLAATGASGAIGTINAATLTASLTGTVSKTYDGTTVATLAVANYGLSGVIGGDAVTLGNTAAGTYDSKNVETGKTVTVTGLTLGGAGAGNYVLASGSVSGAVGAINPAILTAGLTGTVSKTYDGTASASLAAGNYTLSGVVTGESVTLNNPASGTYNNASAGSGKAVSVTGLAISGPGSTNYTLFSGSASANIGVISPKSVTYSVADASSNFGIAPVLGAATLTGVLAPDTVSGTVGLFNGPNSVVANALTPVGFYAERVTGLVGAAAGNYAIAATGNVNGTLTVNAAVVTPGQIITPNVTPPISQTIAQANLQLTTFGATSFVVANGTAVTATLSAPGPGGGRVLTITTMVGNIPVTYTMPVADQGGGGDILGAYSSFDDLLAAAQTTQQASN
jgi:filamentous hemagglutinin family protein